MRHSLPLALILLLLIILHPLSGYPADDHKDADIEDIIITTSESHLLLFATVKHAFSKEMLTGVKNGIPVTFTFLIELEQIKNNWPDPKLAEYLIQHTLSYDTLKEKFIISFTEGKPKAIVTDSAEKAKEAMTELSGLQIIPRKKLISDSLYLLNIKATLAEKTLPLNMHHIIPFISLWNFETDWRSIEFRY